MISYDECAGAYEIMCAASGPSARRGLRRLLERRQRPAVRVERLGSAKLEAGSNWQKPIVGPARRRHEGLADELFNRSNDIGIDLEVELSGEHHL